MLEISGLTKRYDEIVALDDLTMSVRPGRILGFLGPNGAGKTTAFRVALGLTRPQSGAVTVLGDPIPAGLPRVIKRVGAVIEEPGIHKTLSGRDNLRVAAMTLGCGSGEVDRLLEFVGLASDAGRSAGGYSKGMRQRLALAVTLLGDPDVLVLDEPLDGLDPAGQVSFKSKLRQLVDEQGKTVIVSSHDLADVETMADHVVVIDRGALRAAGPLDEVLGGGDSYEVHVGDLAAAGRLLSGAGWEVEGEGTFLRVRGAAGEEISRVLAEGGVFARALIPGHNSLERVFLQLTEEEQP